MKTKPSQINNLVAKHAREFNKATVEIDRKKEEKRGKRKPKHQKRIQL